MTEFHSTQEILEKLASPAGETVFEHREWTVRWKRGVTEWHPLYKGVHPQALDPDGWGDPVVAHCKVCGPNFGWSKRNFESDLVSGSVRRRKG